MSTPKSVRVRAHAAVFWALAMCALGLAVIPHTPAAAEDVPFSITIRHVSCVDDCDETGLEAAVESTADFYVKVWINGVKQPPGSDPDEPSSPRIDDDPSIDPFWTISTTIPESVVNVPVAIQVMDHDSTSPDDLGDASPLNGDNNLDFQVSRESGVWFDPTGRDESTFPQNCSTGDGDTNDDEDNDITDEPRVKVCFDIGGDIDGDGLLDSWERNGYDDDGDGFADVDLPAMGANPECKDLFLEIDSTDNLGGTQLTREDILAVKSAFANAPSTAGRLAGDRDGDNDSENTFGVSAPPDRPGCRGINLHVDTGPLVDPFAREGATPGTCSDGLDNGTNGLVDGQDPTCNPFRPSNPSGISVEPHLDVTIEEPGARNCTGGADNDDDMLVDGDDPDCLVGDAAFADPTLGGGAVVPDPSMCGLDRNFYTAKNGPNGMNPNRRFIFRYAIRAPIKPTGCTNGIGGQGELGGNDFTSFNQGSGTIMHELGHTLNLYHGGFESDHCKPNFVSVMNYNTGLGILRDDGGTILDFSPPRIAVNGSTRGVAPLPTLDEDELDENLILDPTDTENRFVFTNAVGMTLSAPLNGKPNFNGDLDPPHDDDLEMVIDDDGTDQSPAACDNDDEDTLRGADDWTYISLSFHNFGEVSDAALRPVLDDEPTFQELTTNWTSLNTTDLSVSLGDSPDPVAAGTDLTYSVTVTNGGLNPANAAVVTQTLPAGVTYKSSTAVCPASGQILSCAVGSLEPGASRTFTVTVGVPADLVYDNGGPRTISTNATVANLIGPDASPANNSDTEQTTVIAVADVRVTSAASTSPLEVLIGEPTTATLAVGIDNLGPSSPIDTVLTTSATGPTGVTVTPASSVSAQNALAVGTPRSVEFTINLACTTPGMKTVQLGGNVALKNAVDVDPNLTNNARNTSFQIDCVVPIAINIRPQGFPNAINLNTDATIAALTTSAGEYGLPFDFNATSIDVSRTLFGLRSNLFNVATPTGAREIHRQGHPTRSYELDERTRDADLDLVLHFKPNQSGLTLSSTQACLKGKFLAPDGNTYTFLGCDSVRVVN